MSTSKKQRSEKNSVLKYVREKYGTEPEYLWVKYPDYAVLRHSDSGKWYAVIMNVQKSKLGLSGSENVEIINVKADRLMLGSLIMRDGIMPGYHQNKENWISVLLDGTVNKEEIFWLIDLSFNLTCTKSKRAANKDWIVPANLKYYDLDVAVSENPGGFLWKQGSGIRVGDTVYLYVAAPVSAIKYKCSVLEADIPYKYADENVKMERVMKLKLLKKYENPISLSVLKSFGVSTIRGPRGIPSDLLNEIKKL